MAMPIIPVHIPALNIPPIAAQLLKVAVAKNKIAANDNE